MYMHQSINTNVRVLFFSRGCEHCLPYYLPIQCDVPVIKTQRVCVGAVDFCNEIGGRLRWLFSPHRPWCIPDLIPNPVFALICYCSAGTL